MKLRVYELLALLLVVCDFASAQDGRTDNAPVVLTATQATYSITNALSIGTPINVINIPDDGREIAVLRTYFERRKDRFAELFETATAVVSLTNALPADPLYRYARAANVRIVNIEAAIPWTYDTPGVALTDLPPAADKSASGVAPYFWLSISNTMRMADIIATDLSALFPIYADVVATNLDQFRNEMLQMRNHYQDRLLAATGDTVFALTGDFIYMTNDLGLFVDGYFIKQDVDWTDADLQNLTDHLAGNEITTVIHKWLPNEAIQNAVSAADARLVILETGDQGRLTTDDTLAADGLQLILDSNLEKITTAISQ